MDIYFKRSETTSELEQILELQKINLPTVLNPTDLIEEGFVTISHTLELLERMHSVCPHVLAMDGNQVIGYALSMHRIFGHEISIIESMFNQINSLLSNKENYIVMGQICVAKNYRKQGVFRGLYNKMKVDLLPEYQRIITEVDASNKRSLDAHYAVGFETLKIYNADNREWHLIQLK
jgi:hypothetical protein